METKTNGNDPANVVVDTTLLANGIGVMEMRHAGLTKREYFAAMAMQGLLSANSEHTFGNSPIPASSFIAELSVDFADMLIKELNKEG